jgi:glycosyltransferase involved in cell wall biosynthesis
MASGIPVVTVDSGAAPENVKHHINGYLAPPNDIKGLADAMYDALSTDHRAIVENGLQVAQKFSLTQGCQRLEHFYRSLIQATAPDISAHAARN